ncbi:HET-E1 [Symbiodinium natans]|uniref:HET-E1 protein n=1 Tax=Symbiodinium natans TaxID=878477 RepID=A0A812Q096_9DINO|nr:HET-E1 [Symbiodinium natans]
MVGVLTYNIHSGVGSDGVYDLERIAGVVRRSGADIVCLQEVEANSKMLRVRKWSVTHADDQPRRLASICGLQHFAFSATLSATFVKDSLREGEVLHHSADGQYGVCILSRFPIIETRRMLFDRPKGDPGERLFMDQEEQPRGALAVLLDMREEDARPMWVVNTHLSHRMASQEQRRQAAQVLRWIDGLRSEDLRRERSTFLLAADLNSPSFLPWSGYSVIAADSRWRDLWKEAGGPCCCSATFPAGWCGGLFGTRIDHIFGLHLENGATPMCEAARVVRETPADELASDHCAVLVQMDFVEEPFVGEEEVTIHQFTFGTSAPIQLPDFSQHKSSPQHEAKSLRQAGNAGEELSLAPVREERPLPDRPPPPRSPPPAIHRPPPPCGAQPPFVSPRNASPRTTSPRLPGNWHPHMPQTGFYGQVPMQPPNMLWATLAMRFIGLLPMERRRKESICLVLTQVSWKMALFFCPWISISHDDETEAEWRGMQQKMEGVTDHPLMVLGNHASFLDVIVATCAMPTSVLTRCRTYMDAHLFNMPLVSTICRSVGHFPVYFISDRDGVFKVDKEKNEKVDQEVDKHLQAGGWLCFYPEGQCNREPDQLLPFRFGGMKKALEFDARMISVVCHGNTVVWPRKLQMGGFPGSIKVSCRQLAPDGVKALVKKLRESEETPSEDKEAEDHVLLAKHLQCVMQKQHLGPSTILGLQESILVTWLMSEHLQVPLAAAPAQVHASIVCRGVPVYNSAAAAAYSQAYVERQQTFDHTGHGQSSCASGLLWNSGINLTADQLQRPKEPGACGDGYDPASQEILAEEDAEGGPDVQQVVGKEPPLSIRFAFWPGTPSAPTADVSGEEDSEEVQEHLKDAVEGTLRLKRLLSQDSEDGASKKKRALEQSHDREHRDTIDQLLERWDRLDDKVMLHVLEGLKQRELDYLVRSSFMPDEYNFRTIPADQVATQVALWLEGQTLGGGPLDTLQTFRDKWKLGIESDGLLRALNHKDLRYVINHYDGTQDMAQLVVEAKKSSPLEGRTEGCMPDAPGLAAIGRFHRLELIDPTADAVVFGDANLSFALNLAKHRKVLGHVGRVIATTFESLETLRERYEEIDETIKTLEDHFSDVHHEIDCTRIAMNPKFKGLEGTIGAVYYNFPHAGAVGGFFDGHPFVNWRHENLMRLFFRALRSFMKVGGLVKVASNMGAVGVRYSYITFAAKENEFDHVRAQAGDKVASILRQISVPSVRLVLQGQELSVDDEVSAAGLLVPGVELTAVVQPGRGGFEATRVLTTSKDATAKIFDLETGLCECSFNENFDDTGYEDIMSADVSESGSIFLMACANGMVSLYKSSTGERIYRFQLEGLASAALAPDGTMLLLVSAEGDVHLVDWAQNKAPRALAALGRALQAKFSPNSAKVVVAFKEHTAQIFDVRFGQSEQLFEGHMGHVLAARFSPDMSTLLTSCADGVLRLFNANTASLIRDFRRQISISEEHCSKLSSWALRRHAGSARSCCFSPCGESILVGAVSGNVAKMFAVDDGRCTRTFSGHTGLLSSAVFSPSGDAVLTCAGDWTARLYDVETAECLRVFSGHEVETVPFLQWNLHRYGRAYGDRRDAGRRPGKAENYNAQRADRDMVYTFRYNPSGKQLPPPAGCTILT